MNGIDPEKLEVIHDTEAHRFEVRLEDDVAFVEYQKAGNNMVFVHTEVPVAFEGLGIASKMAKVALDYARDNGHKIQAVCPFITAYIRRHTEYQPITWGYF